METARTRLVLTRKPGEVIDIGADITVTLVDVFRGRAKYLIEAPPLVKILRREISGQTPRPTRKIG